MAALTYNGVSEQVFVHLHNPDGTGTLVLTPGESYDFGDAIPPGPAWWWKPAAPPPAAPPPPPSSPVLAPGQPQDKPASDEKKDEG
jgi:hypothetical protein